MNQQVKPYTPFQEWLGNVVIKPMTRINIWVYKKSGGRLMGTFPGGAPILLLKSLGRKSGQRRIAPLLYLKDGDRYIVVASKGGMSHHPAWYLNLKSEPVATIQVKKKRIPVVARQADDEEKAELWPKLVEMYPDYATYQSRTHRNIPVMILEPV